MPRKYNRKTNIRFENIALDSAIQVVNNGLSTGKASGKGNVTHATLNRWLTQEPQKFEKLM